ncbi:MAG: lysostaphin resistance A-like protein [Sandaracinaceae bacterium]
MRSRTNGMTLPESPDRTWWKVALTTLAVVVLVVVAILAASLSEALLSPSHEGLGAVVGALVGTLITWGGLWLLLVKMRRHGRGELGMTVYRMPFGLALGAGIGLLSAFSAFGIAVASGAYSVTFDGSPSWAVVGSLVLSTFVHAYFEELAFRSGLVGSLLRRVPAPIAILVPALLFGAAHLGNPGASAIGTFNTIVLGLALGAMFLPVSGGKRSLGLVTGWHAGWNLAVALCGTAVSGTSSTLWASAEPVGPLWWTGGEYGLEGSLATSIVAVVVLAGAALRVRNASPEPKADLPVAS